MLRVGISACFFHPDPQRATFSKKSLLYYEQSMAHWVMNHGAYPVLLPTATAKMSIESILGFVDGFILHGGADVAPSSYRETPISPKWPGDPIRDKYEIELYLAAKKMQIPVLGICRGLQVINVAEGGTLYQDLNTQNPQTRRHRDADLYDDLFHQVDIHPGTCMAQIYAKATRVKVNSVHHQGVKDLAQSLVAEASSVEDGIIEALRHQETDLTNPQSPYILGVQWHPEFMQGRDGILSEQPLMKNFLKAISVRPRR